MPIDFLKLNEKNKDFFESVYQVVRLIPAGRATSYGAIANYLGAKSGARMVGWAMNAAHHQQEYVPAHRVVNRIGVLSGRHHFPAEAPMQAQLEAEGIQVENDQIIDFKSIFWDPSKELSWD
jgi:methylated-DNA-protein-cysteine methyltransferase-like protein